MKDRQTLDIHNLDSNKYPNVTYIQGSIYDMNKLPKHLDNKSNLLMCPPELQ